MRFSLPRLRRRAFTLLELLIVVVVIGILAALAIIRFGAAQEKAYVATMQSDLRNFATARAIYVSEEVGYPATVSAITEYDFSEHVYEISYRSPSAVEWSLSVGHNKSPTICTLSALDLSRTHRIRCGEAEAVDFAAQETAPNTVEFDATQSIQNLAFSVEADVFALLAARPEDIEQVSWDFGDGSKTSGTPETHTKVSHTYASSGEYMVGLTLMKKTGEMARGGKQLVLASNTAPVAGFTYTPTAPTTTDAVQFTSTSTDANNDALTYAWDFDSNGTVDATTASPQATFSTAATYSVKLTVTDSKGASNSIMQSVTVASAVSPNNVVGNILWLRSDQGVVVSNGTVERWEDQSGVGNHATNTNTAERPVVVASANNGKPSVQFDRVDDLLNTSAHLSDGAQYTVFVVYKVHAHGVSNHQVVGGSSHTDCCKWGFKQTPDGKNTFMDGGGNEYGYTALTNGQWVMATAAPAYRWVNGVQKYYGGWSYYAPGEVRLGGRMSTSEGSGAEIGEVIVYNRTLTDTERTDIEAYLRSRWDVNAPPKASFSFSPTSPEVGQEVTFTSTSTDPDGDALSYAWDFGNWGTATTSTAKMTFTAEGTYSVKLTVTDAKGLSHSATQTLHVGTFTPKMLPNLARWYTAEAGVTLSSGSSVATWADQSAAAAHASQATASKQPQLRTGVINGKPALYFTAASQQVLTFSELQLMGDYTILAVQQTSNDNAILGHTAVNSQIRVGRAGANNISAYDGLNDIFSATFAKPRSSFTILTYQRNGTSSDVTFQEDGAARGGGTSTAAQNMDAIGGLPSHNALYTEGYIAEVVVYNRNLGATERDDLLKYLSRRYAIPVTLSTGAVYTP